MEDIRIRRKLYRKFVIWVICIMLLFCVQFLVHEGAKLLAGEFLSSETNIFFSSDEIFITDHSYNNALFNTRIVCIAGPMGAILFSSLLIKLGKELKDVPLTVSGSIFIICEFMFWMVSPLIKIGEFYTLLQTYTKPNLFLWYFTLLAFFIVICIFLSIRIKTLFSTKIRELLHKYTEERQDLSKAENITIN